MVEIEPFMYTHNTYTHTIKGKPIYYVLNDILDNVILQESLQMSWKVLHKTVNMMQDFIYVHAYVYVF